MKGKRINGKKRTEGEGNEKKIRQVSTEGKGGKGKWKRMNV